VIINLRARHARAVPRGDDGITLWLGSTLRAREPQATAARSTSGDGTDGARCYHEVFPGTEVHNVTQREAIVC